MSISRKTVWSHIALLLLGASGLYRLVPRRWRKRKIRQVGPEEMDEFMARQDELIREVNAILKHRPVRFLFFVAIYVMQPIFDRPSYKRRKSWARMA